MQLPPLEMRHADELYAAEATHLPRLTGFAIVAAAAGAVAQKEIERRAAAAAGNAIEVVAAAPKKIEQRAAQAVLAAAAAHLSTELETRDPARYYWTAPLLKDLPGQHEISGQVRWWIGLA